MEKNTYKNQVAIKMSPQEIERIKENSIGVNQYQFQPDQAMTRENLKENFMQSSASVIFVANNIANTLIQIINDEQIEDLNKAFFKGQFWLTNNKDVEDIDLLPNTDCINTNDNTSFIKILESRLSSNQKYKIKIKFTKYRKFKEIFDYVKNNISDSSIFIKFSSIHDCNLLYELKQSNHVIGFVGNSQLNLNILFDTNFKISKDRGNKGYQKIYEGFEAERSQKSFLRKKTFRLLEEESKGKYTFHDELYLKEMFKKRISQMNKDNPEVIEEMAELSFEFFNDLLNQIIEYRNYVKTKTRLQLDDFESIKKALFANFVKRGVFKESFCKDNEIFFEKLWLDLEYKSYKTPLLVDWMLVLYSMLFNIFDNPEKCIVISDDNDILVISKIFARKIIPKLVTIRFLRKYRKQFDNYQDRIKKIQDDGFEDLEDFSIKLFEKVDDIIAIYSNFYSDYYKDEIGIVYVPKKRKLITIKFDKILIHYLQNLNSMINARLNEALVSTILDINLWSNLGFAKLNKYISKKSRNGEVVIASKNELLRIL